MPQVSHRLNLLLVPEAGRSPPEGLDELLDELRADPEAVIPGGFALARVDRPPGLAVYGNRQGGFHVRCPSCGANMARELSAAVEAARAGAPRDPRCPGCGSLAMDRLLFEPPAAIGPFAIELRDVQGLEPSPAWAGRLESLLGPLRRIGSRG